jgi:hypothetical protein
MSRKTKEELSAVQKKYEVDRLWSWSRFNCYTTSPYEYYLKYLTDKKEDRTNSIYTYSGSLAHDILEKLYSGEIEYGEMSSQFEDGWSVFEIADLKFDRNSEEKNDSVKNKYVANLRHFFKHYKMIDRKVKIEKFITAQIGEYVFQGYIDMIYKDTESNIVIHDHKTSSIYKGKKAESECGQLLVYAIAINQMGVPFDKIRICWDFLKYTQVTICMANGKQKTREIERCKIGSELQANVKMWLKKLDYEDEIDEHLSALLEFNDISVLPKDVQAKYEFDNCRVFVPITENLIEGIKDKIVTILDEIKEKEKQYQISKNDKLFWDDKESVKAQSFYFSNLCSFSPQLHKPYGEYLKNREDGISHNDTEIEDDDMSWLEDV